MDNLNENPIRIHQQDQIVISFNSERDPKLSEILLDIPKEDINSKENNENESELAQEKSTKVNTLKECKKEEGESINCIHDEDSNQKKDKNLKNIQNWSVEKEKEIKINKIDKSTENLKEEINSSDLSPKKNKSKRAKKSRRKIICKIKKKSLVNRRRKNIESLDKKKKRFKKKKTSRNVYNDINRKENYEEDNFHYSEQDELDEKKYKSFYRENENEDDIENDDDRLNLTNLNVSRTCSNNIHYQMSEVIPDNMTVNFAADNSNYFTESPQTNYQTNII